MLHRPDNIAMLEEKSLWAHRGMPRSRCQYLAAAITRDPCLNIQLATNLPLPAARARCVSFIEAYRFVKNGLRIAGETVYDFGVAAENMTVEATEVRPVSPPAPEATRKQIKCKPFHYQSPHFSFLYLPNGDPWTNTRPRRRPKRRSGTWWTA